jgi:MoxR-like ATPase
MSGRDFVVPDDVVALAAPVLAHRLLLTPEAELDRFTATDALSNVLASVPIPR